MNAIEIALYKKDQYYKDLQNLSEQLEKKLGELGKYRFERIDRCYNYSIILFNKYHFIFKVYNNYITININNRTKVITIENFDIEVGNILAEYII